MIEAVGVVIDEFVLVGTYAVMGVNMVVCQVHPVAVIHRCLPAFWCFAVEQGANARSLEGFGNVNVRVVEKGGGKVGVEDHVGVGTAGFDLFGIADDEGHAERFFVHKTLVIPAVIAQEKALVRCVNDDGVVGEAFCIEIVEHAPDIVVDGGHTAQVVFDVALVFPFFIFFR